MLLRKKIPNSDHGINIFFFFSHVIRIPKKKEIIVIESVKKKNVYDINNTNGSRLDHSYGRIVTNIDIRSWSN